MAITNLLGRNKNKIENQTTNSNAHENKQHEDTDVVAKNLKSINIELELADIVADSLESENIFFKIDVNEMSARLWIEKDDAEFVSQILIKCRNELTDNFKQKNEDTKKPPINDQIQSGTLRRDVGKRQDDKLYKIEINPELQEALSSFVESENIQHTFYEENEKTFIGFWNYENGKIILEYYTKLKELAETYTDKIREQLPEQDDINEQKTHLETENPEVKTKQKKVKNKKSTRQILGRTEQIMTRFTPDEMKIVQDKISTSQKKQGDYIREMLLNGYVKAHPAKLSDAQLIIQELQNMNAQLGKLTGAMVKIMQRTKENPSLSKEDRESIQFTINDTKKVRKEIRKVLKELWQ